MGEAEIEGEIDDALVGPRRLQPDIELCEPDVLEHRGDRGAEMTAKAELQRANAGPSNICKLFEIERLGSLRLQPDARPPERRRLGFDTAVEDIDGVA